MNLPELLSPAGGMDSLKAAVENGADAVYMGGRLYNARINADNFEVDDMRRAIGYAHVRGVNVYITMNTLIADAEMQQALDAAGEAYLAGADALIVQDLGFASLVREHIPALPLHLSTQGTVYSAQGIRALSPLGFARVILARELSLNDITRIAGESPVPVEVFAHGALCVCFSGQCLMSSMIGSRSGNRGRCAQPCRLPYTLRNEKGYLLSPKDLCSVALLPELVRSGVAALKIEGRMKSPEYVAVVTSVYRKYLNLVSAGGPYAVDETDMQDLLQVFNRGGFSTGYLLGRQGGALLCRERPKHWGVPLGKVVARKAKGVLDVNLTGRLALGDGVEVINDTLPGGIVTYLTANGRKAAEAGPGRAELGYVEGQVRPGDALVKTSDKALNERARQSFTDKPRKKECIHGELTARVGERLRFSVWDGDGNHVSVEGAEAAPAVTLPLTEEAALGQLNKTGDSPFELADCRVDVDGIAAAKLSELNALRRQALSELEALRANKYSARASVHAAVEPPCGKSEAAKPRLSLYLYRWRDDLSDLLHMADRVYAPITAFTQGRVKLAARPKELMAWLPAVTFGSLNSSLGKHAKSLADMGFDGVLAGNAEHMELLKECGLPLYGDASLNAFNAHTLALYGKLGLKGVALSQELTMAQIAALPGCGLEKEAAVYGRLPLMPSAHCPVGAEVAKSSLGKPCGLCRKNEGYTLKDRTGARFPVLCDAGDCRSLILNADILAVPELAGRLARAGVSTLRLYIHDEPPREVERVLTIFRRALQGETNDELKGRGYTKGHYFRGV